MFKLSGGDVADIIRWYGEDTYEKLNLFGVWEGSLKSVVDKNFCLSIFW